MEMMKTKLQTVHKVLFALYSFSFDLCRNVESNEYLLTWFMGFGMGIYFKFATIFMRQLAI